MNLHILESFYNRMVFLFRPQAEKFLRAVCCVPTASHIAPGLSGSGSTSHYAGSFCTLGDL